MQNGQTENAAIPLATDIHHIYQEAIKKGFGNNNITGVVQLFL
jgi:3-hydroxyisobutyrate dehydrogenase-like beta-hydroxyacid dehydrogenase